MRTILKEFERQSQAMGVKEELINDNTADFSADEDEERYSYFVFS